MSSTFKLVKIIDPQVIVTGGLVPKGIYNNATSYNIGDSVSYNGSSYVAITISTGNLPTVATNWQLLAAKGSTGAGGAFSARQVPVESPDGTRVTFTAPNPYLAGTLSVFLNGLYELAISETSTTTFTFTTAPFTGDIIALVYAK